MTAADPPAEAVEVAAKRAWNHIPADNPTPDEVRVAVAAALTAAWPFRTFARLPPYAERAYCEFLAGHIGWLLGSPPFEETP